MDSAHTGYVGLVRREVSLAVSFCTFDSTKALLTYAFIPSLLRRSYGDWSRFALVPWEIPALEVLTRLTVFVAQIFFAQRCYALYNRSRVVFTGVMIVITALSISLLTDLSITGLTVWKLGRRGGHTLSPNTDDVIQRLRNVTLEAAAPPAIAAFLNLALCFRWTDYTYHWFGLMTPKLYVWSLMFTLNSRVAIREKFNSPNQGDDDRAGKLSTGFEFAKSSRLNRKPRGADRGHDRTTFILSDLSRPPQVSGITAEEATEMDEDLQRCG
ncbi:hypothetical protein FRC05_005209 [Tulasnella sp. 425]|nr:hypothetical protein FRC05_005209 [Tulasnella sp. 425]